MKAMNEAQIQSQADPGPELSTALEEEEKLSEVLNVLSTLPANQQEVLRLKFQSGLSYLEISHITNLSVSNVGFLIHTGIKTIRERVRTQTVLRRVK